jgi:hypothetical protein
VAAQLIKAQGLVKAGDDTKASIMLDAILKVEPENSEAKQMMTDLQQRQQVQAAEAERKEATAKRERHPREYFERRMKAAPNSELFDQQEVKVKGKLDDIESKIVRTITNQTPVFQIRAEERPDKETFFLSAFLPMKSAGWRRCDLVGGQSSNGEVALVFKVFEYSYVEAFSIRALIKDNAEENMVPIHSSRLGANKGYLLVRREEGIRLVRERIREAVGE